MKIDMSLLLPVSAVVASVLLLIAGRKRLVEIIAVIAASVWLAVHLGLLSWPIRAASLGLVVGGTLVVTGVLVYLRVKNKREVTASTVVAILGGVLLISALRLG
jgi:hypothetical protein